MMIRSTQKKILLYNTIISHHFLQYQTQGLTNLEQDTDTTRTNILRRMGKRVLFLNMVHTKIPMAYQLYQHQPRHFNRDKCRKRSIRWIHIRSAIVTVVYSNIQLQISELEGIIDSLRNSMKSQDKGKKRMQRKTKRTRPTTAPTTGGKIYR